MPTRTRLAAVRDPVGNLGAASGPQGRRHWTTGRMVAAVIVLVVTAFAALIVGAGVLVGGCWGDCRAPQRFGQVALAVGAFTLVLGGGLLGVRAAHSGWRAVGLWFIAAVVIARLGEFVVTRV